jgi:hypothetical protein
MRKRKMKMRTMLTLRGKSTTINQRLERMMKKKMKTKTKMSSRKRRARTAGARQRRIEKRGKKTSFAQVSKQVRRK